MGCFRSFDFIVYCLSQIFVLCPVAWIVQCNSFCFDEEKMIFAPDRDTEKEGRVVITLELLGIRFQLEYKVILTLHELH